MSVPEDQRSDAHRPFFRLLTPRPEEETFNEFGDGQASLRESIAGLFNRTALLPQRHQDGDATSLDEYQELPAGRDEYDPYARAAGDRKVQFASQPSYGNLLSSLPERQEDFITVDWAYYAEKDRQRRIKLETRIHKLPWYQQTFLHAWDGAQSWIALLVIGFLTGAVAALIGVGCDWFTDLRFGLCRGRGFWITREICCKDVHEVCEHWIPWSRMLPEMPMSTAMVDFFSYAFISTAMAVYAAWLCVAISPYAAGSGISEIKVVLGGFVIKRLLGGWTLLAKSIGLMLSVGSGMMVGKEGPCVHLACCAANLVSRFFSKFRDNEARKRELMSSAAAAGVAVAFGAPVGGVLFSLEEVSSYFPPQTMWRSIFCAIVAAFTITRLDPLPFHRHVMFEVHFHHEYHLFELIPFAFLGVVGGVIGATFVRVNTRILARRKQSIVKRWPLSEVALVCLITSLVDYPVVYLQGSNISLLHSLFSDCREHFTPTMCSLEHAHQIIIALIVCGCIKFLLTLFTFGLKIPGGIFVPSLTIGALFGRAVGFTVQALHQTYLGDSYVFEVCKHTSTCIKPAIYAIVGAAAVLAGVTRMTVSLVVIMIEVTNGMQYVLPLMLAIIVSKMVADMLGDESIYIEHIRMNGLPLLDAKSEYLYGETARDAMHGRELRVLTLTGETMQSLQTLLEQTAFRGFPVVTSLDDMAVVGYIRRQILQRMMQVALEEEAVRPDTPCIFSRSVCPATGAWIDLSPYLDRSPTLIFDTTPFDRAVEMVRGLGLRYLLVTSDGKLVGIIKKKDLLEHIEYHRSLRHRASDNAL
jgi:chloride channel 3/4/5